MNFKAEIKVKGHTSQIRKLFAAEGPYSRERASYVLETDGDWVIFKIIACDSSALRAALNSVTGMLAVFEKALETKE